MLESAWLLLTSSFLSATLLPGTSEALFAWQVVAGGNAAVLLPVATLGNTLGALTTWGLGRLGSPLASRGDGGDEGPPRGGAESAGDGRREERARAWLHRHGDKILVLAWLPFIGDALCLVAGFYRLGLLRCAAFIGLGKALRYTVVLLAVRGGLALAAAGG